MFRQSFLFSVIFGAFTFTTLVCTPAKGCPEISGSWKCYEASMDYKYDELIEITQQSGVYHYSQVMKEDSYETPSPEKITDSVERMIEHIIVENHDWYFYHKSFCPSADTLQTHETVLRKDGNKVIGKSSADFILTLNADSTLEMITNSVDEDGKVYDREFVGHCTHK